jgi:Domain of unknown function (DUF4382)
MKNLHRLPVCFALLALLVVAPACNSHTSTGTHHAAGMATLSVHLTDAPIDMSNVQSVMVTLTGVTVYPADSDSAMELPDGTEGMDADADPAPVSLMDHPATFDLLTLTDGATTLLASGEVPAGSYSRIRLEISDAQIVYQDGTSAPLKIDSQKVDIPLPFSLSVNEDMSITLDFNAAASVQVNETGNGTLILRPVVTPVGSH